MVSDERTVELTGKTKRFLVTDRARRRAIGIGRSDEGGSDASLLPFCVDLCHCLDEERLCLVGVSCAETSPDFYPVEERLEVHRQSEPRVKNSVMSMPPRFGHAERHSCITFLYQ